MKLFLPEEDGIFPVLATSLCETVQSRLGVQQYPANLENGKSCIYTEGWQSAKVLSFNLPNILYFEKTREHSRQVYQRRTASVKLLPICLPNRQIDRSCIVQSFRQNPVTQGDIVLGAFLDIGSTFNIAFISLCSHLLKKEESTN